MTNPTHCAGCDGHSQGSKGLRQFQTAEGTRGSSLEGLWQHKDSTTPISSAVFRESNRTRWPSSLLDGPSMIKSEEEEEEEPNFNDQIHSKMSFLEWLTTS